MDEETVKKRGSKPLQDILSRIVELFPAEDTSVNGLSFQNGVNGQQILKSKYLDKLTHTVVYLMKLDVTSLVSFSVGVS